MELFNKLWVVMVPFIFGIGFWYTYLMTKAKVTVPNLWHGLLAWVGYLIFSFIGQMVAMRVHPSAYRGAGDNPIVVAGLMMTILASFVICPILFVHLRQRVSEKRKKMDG